MSLLPRRFRSFSLRTLMLLMGLIGMACGWVASERRFVTKRKLCRATMQKRDIYTLQFSEPSHPLSWIRRVLGDEYVELIYVPRSMADAQVNEVAQLFNEAAVVRYRRNKDGGILEGEEVVFPSLSPQTR